MNRVVPCRHLDHLNSAGDRQVVEAPAVRMPKPHGTAMPCPAKCVRCSIPKAEVLKMGWFAWFKDPEGNDLGLWKPVMRG